MSDGTTTTGDDGITLKDVIFHIQGVQQSMRSMEERLTKRIDKNSSDIQDLKGTMDSRFERVENRLDRVEVRLDAIDEDLLAVGMDVISIKQHTGMPVALE